MNTNTPKAPHIPQFQSRRDFLLKAGGGFGALALAMMLDQDGLLPAAADGPTAANAMTPRPPHFHARATSVIFLFMEGGPSHIDLFDPKPVLNRLHGQPLPESFGRIVTSFNVGDNPLLGTRRTFRKFGQAGLEFSDWLPHLAQCADDLCVVRSLWCDAINHAGGVCQMNTGSLLGGRPSLGSWATYGLGSVTQNLPGFVVMQDTNGEVFGGARNWSAGFIPSSYQGTAFRPGDTPILNVRPPAGVDARQQRARLDLLKALNEEHRAARPGDDNLTARIESYELAYRMQAAAPETVDLSQESAQTSEEYGLNRPECAALGRQCLLARRLVERGVRMVQIYCGAGSQWDAHSGLETNHTDMCRRADQPSAALIRDLKRRGLLENTLVIWGGEFGRTPMSQSEDGRDHNPTGFTMLFAGGGVRPGSVIGATDEIGLNVVENPVHVHELHATILYLMGLDHHRLTFLHNGREERLTENGGRVVRDMIG